MLPGGAGDPGTNCNATERSLPRAEWEHEGVGGRPCLGAAGEAPQTPRQGLRTRNRVPGAATEGQDLPRWENGDFGLNVGVILRPESTRQTEKAIHWARERPNWFFR